MKQKNPQKQGRILEEGGGKYFSGWPEYIHTPARDIYHEIKTIRLYKPFS